MPRPSAASNRKLDGERRGRGPQHHGVKQRTTSSDSRDDFNRGGPAATVDSVGKHHQRPTTGLRLEPVEGDEHGVVQRGSAPGLEGVNATKLGGSIR